MAAREFSGLCFANLVDFDMLYGHRRDVDGYAAALTEFDAWLGGFLDVLGEDDLLIITADHGCDPAFAASTDHTREYVPLIVTGQGVKPQALGTRNGFSTVAATVAQALASPFRGDGVSLLDDIL
jgi:phosphopentomutase